MTPFCGADETRTRDQVNWYSRDSVSAQKTKTPFRMFLRCGRDSNSRPSELVFTRFGLCTKNKNTLSDVFAVRTRLELATYGVTGRYSNQLNYRTLSISKQHKCLVSHRAPCGEVLCKNTCSVFQKRVQKYCFFLN